MSNVKKSYYLMEFSFPANILELYSHGNTLLIIRALMDEHISITGSKQTNYAKEFVFDKQVSYPVKEDGYGAIFLEFMNSRHKDQYKVLMADFISWLNAEMGVTLADEVELDILYRHLNKRTSFEQVEPNGTVVPLKGTFANAAFVEVSNNVTRRKGYA